MTKEQCEQAKKWADQIDEAFMYGVRITMRRYSEITALLRAGIAASEECERLRSDHEDEKELRKWLLYRDFLGAQAESAWLAAWDAEWRAQEFKALARQMLEGRGK